MEKLVGEIQAADGTRMKRQDTEHWTLKLLMRVSCCLPSESILQACSLVFLASGGSHWVWILVVKRRRLCRAARAGVDASLKNLCVELEVMIVSLSSSTELTAGVMIPYSSSFPD